MSDLLSPFPAPADSDETALASAYRLARARARRQRQAEPAQALGRALRVVLSWPCPTCGQAWPCECDRERESGDGHKT